jgi:hypothetical protein
MSDKSTPCEPLKVTGDLIDLGPSRRKFIRKYQVVPDIHSADFIFRILYEYFHGGRFEEALDWYYFLGRLNAEKVAELAAAFLRRQPGTAISLLDFASGYGAVARHIHKALPGADLTAMDIHEQAQHFNQERLNIRAVLSSTDPAGLPAPGKYDIVFALSFFSHMPRATFFPWLVKLTEFVKDDGLLIFTTHGRLSHRLMKEINVESDGFGFTPFSEQKDLSVEEYGLTITYHEFVVGELRKLQAFELLLFRQGFWWKHQDCWVLLKGQIPNPGPNPKLPPGLDAFGPDPFLQRIFRPSKNYSKHPF